MLNYNNVRLKLRNSLPERHINKIKQFTLPGFGGIPVYSVGGFFVRSLNNSALAIRASSVAFNFFLAIFPALIFFLSLIAYIRIENFHHELMKLLHDMMPTNAYLSVRGTILDIIRHKRTGLISFGFIAALYFSTNGINALISAFNASQFVSDKRNWLQKRGISVMLVVILALLMTVSIALMVFSKKALGYIVESGILEKDFTYYLIVAGKWITIVLSFFLSISFLYYFAPAHRTKFRFFSAGSTLATILCILISLAFSYYVNNFGQYNKLYGSIGTLMVILLWLYFNSLVLLIGYELNWSIRNAKAGREKIQL